MNITDIQLTQLIADYVWPFIRIGAFLLALPVISSGIVPVYIKTGLAIFITILIVPTMPEQVDIAPFSTLGLIVTINQVIIGLCLGFMIKLVFSAMETGGHLIGQSMGIGFAQMNDPANGVTVPVISQFYTIMATLIFLIIDGHLIMINVLANSFVILPVDITGLGTDGIWQVIKWSSWIFTGAVLIALPAVGALLLVSTAFGVMMRAAPQLNIFSIGFPISLMLGFFFMMYTLPVFSTQFQYLLNITIVEATNILK